MSNLKSIREDGLPSWTQVATSVTDPVEAVQIVKLGEDVGVVALVLASSLQIKGTTHHLSTCLHPTTMKDFATPQNVKRTPVHVKSWKTEAGSCTTQDPQLRKLWSQPDWIQFKLRSKTYLQNKIKSTGGPPLFELVWFESFKGTHEELMHICHSKKSFVNKAMAKFGNDIPQLFVVTLIIPGSPLVATVQYFARTKSASVEEPTEAEKLWERFLNSDDAFRNARFKLIPTIVDGPWVIQKSVGTTPCIISKAIKTTYYQSPNYLEVHVDISSDTIAKHITSLCRSQSTHFTVNMGFVIEGQTERNSPRHCWAACSILAWTACLPPLSTTTNIVP